jgi:hypothetical protein
MGQHWARAAAVAAVLWLGIDTAQAGPAAACEAAVPPQIRIYDCGLATALAGGLERAPSLRTMVTRIGELRGIVIVKIVTGTPATGAAAGLSHRIANSGETRVLDMQFVRSSQYNDTSVAMLAHEFRHALEVLENPDVKTEADVNRLYERIGFASADRVVETDAAIAMGVKVASELKAARLVARRR